MTNNNKSTSFDFANNKFYVQYWEPETVEASLVVVHGMGEHSGRYGQAFAQAFNKRNIAVLAFDQFGHGKTTGKKGHTPGYRKNLESITKALELAQEIFGDVPQFLYGHSMGGNLVANYILKVPSNILGAVISSPMLKLAFTPPKWKLALGSMLRNVYPSFTEKTGLDVSNISRDSISVEQYKNDPLVHDRVSINYSLPFFEDGLWAIKNSDNLNKKIFIFHGTGDKITDANATQSYAENAGDSATLKLYENGYHELHNDLCRDEVLKDMCDWVESFLYTSFRV